MTVREYFLLKFPCPSSDGTLARRFGNAVVIDGLQVECLGDDFVKKCIKLSEAVEAWVQDPLPKPDRYSLHFEFDREKVGAGRFFPPDRVFFVFQGMLKGHQCGSTCSISLYAFEDAPFDLLTRVLDEGIRMMVQAVRDASFKNDGSK